LLCMRCRRSFHSSTVSGIQPKYTQKQYWLWLLLAHCLLIEDGQNCEKFNTKTKHIQECNLISLAWSLEYLLNKYSLQNSCIGNDGQNRHNPYTFAVFTVY
jgi:hypothetical protein